MKDLNGEISEIKAEKIVKFNEYYNILNYFVLKDNELYCRAFKVGQPKRLFVCDYNTADIIKKIYA